MSRLEHNRDCTNRIKTIEEEKNMFSLLNGLAGGLMKVGKIVLAVIVIFYALLLVTAW